MDDNKLTAECMEQIEIQEQRKEDARLQIVAGHIHRGVEFTDWKHAYIDTTVTIGRGTKIGPGVILEGDPLGKTASSARTAESATASSATEQKCSPQSLCKAV